MLEFVPKHILKVIDTHDKMGGRYAAQKARGVKTEFFSCSPEDEGRYLRRADIVIARREEEARYFNEVSGQDSAIVIPHVEPPHFLQRSFERVHAVGLVASANRINLDLVTDFLHAVQSQQAAPPFEVRIAGQVSTMIKDVSACKREVFHCPWVKILGFVEDIAGFYEDVDLVVSHVIRHATCDNRLWMQGKRNRAPNALTRNGRGSCRRGVPHLQAAPTAWRARRVQPATVQDIL